MRSMQSSLYLELPRKASPSLSFHRLRQPTPLPTLRGPLQQQNLAQRLLALLVGGGL